MTRPRPARRLAGAAFLLGLAGALAAGPAAAQAAAPATPGTGWAVYHVFVGHFANGNRANDTEGLRGHRHKAYAGGDLKGLLSRVDYIAALGVDAVWLSPIFEAETDHGYDVLNYYRIGGMRAVPGDPEASLALYRQLRDALHARGIKLILDVPLNHGHSGYDLKNGDPGGHKPKRTRAKQEAEKTWEGWGAKFGYWDLDDEGTRRFLKDVALHWLVAEGADGLRLDYVRGVDHRFWAELYKELKAAKPDALLIGEAWQDEGTAEANAVDIKRYYEPVPGIGRQFDSLFDFPTQMAFTEAFGRGTGLAQVEEWLKRTEAMYGALGRPAHFLDNHDVARLNAWAGSKDRVVAAVGLLSALSGPFVMFYGTETGLAGQAKRGFTDEGRIPMPWDGLDRAMVDRVSAYLKLRRENPVLRSGERVPLLADDTALVMAKREGGRVALVGVNLSDSPREVTVRAAGLLQPGAALAPATGGEAPRVAADGTVTWRLAPVSTQIALSR
ncbi:MAG TPA: alpha-amylase family glycosyl hydrolase [Alphaproteobacteria bacterium]|nr:alpha-amylase family glycosyl hydrolase [Alphaproteobacteria bacterium]